jgi:phosphate transport system protein
MMEQSVALCFGAHLMFCTKNLERIGDHTTNIAEAVHYMVKGETPLSERPKADFASMLTMAMGRTYKLRLQPTQHRRSELTPL